MGFGPTGRNLKQAITYWAPTTNNRYGEPSFVAPVLLLGRWTVLTTMVENADGNSIQSNAQVFLSTDVEEQGFLAIGDYTATGTLTPNPHTLGSTVVSEIKAFRSQPDLRVLEQERRAYI